MRKRIIIRDVCGQLGNTLYRAGNLIAFGLENQVTVWDRSLYLTGYAKLFPAVRRQCLLRFPHSIALPFSCTFIHGLQSFILRRLGKRKCYLTEFTNCFNKPKLLETQALFPGKTHTVTLNGWQYHDRDAVIKHGNFLRRLFTPDKSITQMAEQEIARLRKDHAVVIAVHIRQGDYREFLDGRYFFTPEQYHSAMLSSQETFKGRDVMFAIFSDEEKIDLSTFGTTPHTRLPHRCISFDWYAMSLCDYIIGPKRSTYSGWASFYGKTPIFRMEDSHMPTSPHDFIIDEGLEN